MSRYENGVHEPPFPVIENIAGILKVPVAYFFCNDDRLAEIMLIYTALADSQRQTLLEAATSLRDNPTQEH